LQILWVFEGWNEALIVVGIDLYWESEGTLTPPVATAFEIAHLPPRHGAQAVVHLSPTQACVGAEQRVLRSHCHHHV
jgi:hypothetical protein